MFARVLWVSMCVGCMPLYVCMGVIPYTGIYPLWTDLLFIFRFLLLLLLLLLPYSHLLLQFSCFNFQCDSISFLFVFSSYTAHVCVYEQASKRKIDKCAMCLLFALYRSNYIQIWSLRSNFLSLFTLKQTILSFFFVCRISIWYQYSLLALEMALLTVVFVLINIKNISLFYGRLLFHHPDVVALGKHSNSN